MMLMLMPLLFLLFSRYTDECWKAETLYASAIRVEWTRIDDLKSNPCALQGLFVSAVRQMPSLEPVNGPPASGAEGGGLKRARRGVAHWRLETALPRAPGLLGSLRGAGGTMHLDIGNLNVTDGTSRLKLTCTCTSHSVFTKRKTPEITGWERKNVHVHI